MESVVEQEALATTVEWEVWRSHLKHPDWGPRRIGYGLSESRARQLLAECRADPALLVACDFYLVKVTSTREAAR